MPADVEHQAPADNARVRMAMRLRDVARAMAGIDRQAAAGEVTERPCAASVEQDAAQRVIDVAVDPGVRKTRTR